MLLKGLRVWARPGQQRFTVSPFSAEGVECCGCDGSFPLSRLKECDMSAGVLRAWWSKLCSICFVVSIVLPTTAPFQVVAANQLLPFGRSRESSPRGMSTSRDKPDGCAVVAGKAADIAPTRLPGPPDVDHRLCANRHDGHTESAFPLARVRPAIDRSSNLIPDRADRRGRTAAARAAEDAACRGVARIDDRRRSGQRCRRARAVRCASAGPRVSRVSRGVRLSWVGDVHAQTAHEACAGSFVADGHSVDVLREGLAPGDPAAGAAVAAVRDAGAGRQSARHRRAVRDHLRRHDARPRHQARRFWRGAAAAPDP